MTEKLKGTASVLHETKTYEELVEKGSVPAEGEMTP